MDDGQSNSILRTEVLKSCLPNSATQSITYEWTLGGMPTRQPEPEALTMINGMANLLLTVLRSNQPIECYK